MKKSVFNWSGGKDSSLTLYHILKEKKYEVASLLTSINEKYQRISMHGVRASLLDEQAESLGLPLVKLQVPEMPTMEQYNQLMHEHMSAFNKDGVECAIFGDIFLEDLKKFREDQLAKAGMTGVFPIWKRPTVELFREFLDLGFKAVTTCVNEKYLDKSFVGREMDEQFFKDLPEDVDPCGENGEFHSFVFDGPIFQKPISFVTGETVHKEYKPCAKERKERMESAGYSSHDDVFTNGFWYCDLIAEDEASLDPAFSI